MKRFATILGLTSLALLSCASDANAVSLKRDSDLFKELSKYVQEETVAFQDLDLKRLDPNSLYWDGQTNNVDVFFINEGAGYRNQLLFGANDGSLEMIFEDVSSPDSIMPRADGSLLEADGPLALGEGVRLRPFQGPTQLSFFIRANGFNGGDKLYGSDDYASTQKDGQIVNHDNLSHLIAYEYESNGETYTILGFEDLWGVDGQRQDYEANSEKPDLWADRDFNDVVFAVKGLSSVKPSVDVADVPEPSSLLGLFGLGMIGLGRKWTKKTPA